MKAELITTTLEKRLNITYDDRGTEKLVSLNFTYVKDDTYTLRCSGEFLTDITALINHRNKNENT